ncbi:zinc-dependent metalloprotease [Flavobacterium quisquiliarum]|uniref:Reprolysin-like metallopeptidase n=1 Tax=Flavobacterium quisquiliarum TaxID=1834436 RepID=A0ABV8WB69_9FLAO|nr:zinc-dependent metalloprotease family protein [Flavobacterium quisquiliarum]MBW1658335.1 T9SS type A sorting domain-containing protein [Flavobacterium quisquiliarum]NWL02136.1 propanediol utilization protein [Flavobacterium collinsii]
MKKQLLYIFLILCGVTVNAQNDILWQKITSSSSLSQKLNNSDPGKLYFKLNADLLHAKLSPTTSKFVTNAEIEITIPNTDGTLERFLVWESSNFDPELQAKYPEIRAYKGRGIDDKSAVIYFSVAPIGMQTMVFRGDKPTEYIEQNPDSKSEYVLFKSTVNADSEMRLECKTANTISENKTSSTTARTASNAKQLKTLRLALSCTGEYAAYFGGTKAGALTGMNATLTRVNGIFDRDLSVQLVLIANNDAVVYTNASTDPYSIAADGAKDGGTWGQEVQTTLTNVIGNANYDIGHLFGASGGGGNAHCIGCVCVDPTSSEPYGKGSAFTSPKDRRPEGDTFDIDFVAHEMGHQLGASHTFSYALEGLGTSYEPGSGSTIMGYAGITNFDVQNNSDDYFSYASINQIQNNLATKSCPVSTPITNNPPIIDAGPDYTIPISTPFVLKGTGSDPEGSTITYTWEQYDNATNTSGENSKTYPTKPNGPMFRSLPPTTSPVRYMPAFSSVLNNALTTTWESVSSIAKTMNFTLTGRDNATQPGTAQTSTDAMVVTVSASAGPFAITSQNAGNVAWAKGSVQTITWSVNNTNTLQGSSNVNIKLSTDGGATFPITLASNTPNDGSETILVPSEITESTNCRLLIEPVGNIYYAVNTSTFAIGYSVSTTCLTYNFDGNYSTGNSQTFINKTVSVPASVGTISDVNVSVNVTHARFSDLEMQIVSPSGKVVTLFNKSCGATNSTLALQFDDSGTNLNCGTTTSQIVIPASALTAFNNENSQGTWTFGVRDTESGALGTINSASVNICNKVYTLGDSDFENIDFALYPNPNRGHFTIQFSRDSIKEVKVYVHDILGKYVYNNTFQGSGYFIQDIQLPNVPAGLYFVTVSDGDRRTIKKIIVY